MFWEEGEELSAGCVCGGLSCLYNWKVPGSSQCESVCLKPDSTWGFSPLAVSSWRTRTSSELRLYLQFLALG